MTQAISYRHLAAISFLLAVGNPTAEGVELPKPQPCIYPFPESDDVLLNNIVTVLPQAPPMGGAGTLYDGGIATLNGYYPAYGQGQRTTDNNLYSILIKDQPARDDISYVGHFTLGGNVQLSETDIAVHGQARVPARLNVYTAFLPYTCLNLSGRLLTDVSLMPASGLKIYSAGATFTNGLAVVGSRLEKHGEYINVEIAAPTLVYNNFGLAIGYGMGPELCMFCPGNTTGTADDIHGALIFHARSGHCTTDEPGEDSLYAPITCMGDLTGKGKHVGGTHCRTNNIVFYSKWDDNAETHEQRYNIPNEKSPFFICNSLKCVWSDVDVFAVRKPEKDDMSPMSATHHQPYRRLTGDEHQGQIVSVLDIDGRVYSYFCLDGKAPLCSLEEAVIVQGSMTYTDDQKWVLTHGSTLDMRKAGNSLSLSRVTAGTPSYGDGKVLVKKGQLISMDSHKTIRHEIHGHADMDITGTAKAPINISFERLLEPHKDRKQARYELNTININHAHVYVGPGNIVAGNPRHSTSGIFCRDNVELFNYGVITQDVHVQATSRVVNSHYAKSEILKHNCVCCSPWYNHFIDIPLDTYPGTMQGNVVLEEGAEFCNYGDVFGDISVATDAVLYGCGTCGGTVTLNPNSIMYFDHGLHIAPGATGYFWQIHNDTTVKYKDGAIKHRPDGNVGNLVIKQGALLAFRVSAPTTKQSPNVLTVRNELSAPHTLNIRLDIDGSVTELLPRNGSKGRIKLMQVLKPYNARGFSGPVMHITSGAELIEQARLVWDSREGALYLEAKLSPQAQQNKKPRKPRTTRRRRR